jgi:hypothetical protein
VRLRAIYDACYLSEGRRPAGFDQAERYRTVHHRRLVGAAQEARGVLDAQHDQLLFASLL